MNNDNDDAGLSPLMHQVAGCHSGTPSNILINMKGQILKPYKPISNPTFDPDKDVNTKTDSKDLIPVTLNELQFYTILKNSTNPDFVLLREIAPKFYGSQFIRGTDHLILEDLTYGMKSPCVMDLKIGKDRYYPGRSPDKAKLDTVKYPCLHEFGFCVTGIKLSNPSTGEVDFHLMPKVTRKFSSEEVAEHVRKFLHFGEKRSEILHKKVVEGGSRILNWASTQRSIFLRGSSLLFIYDAAGLKDTEAENEKNTLNIKVCTIDFAHPFHSFGEEDTNYVEGLSNLVQLLKTGKLPK
ncbi:UNVERIFIED_CONTAM: hypothetical protein RMT77_014895 [Armadillidium vulgare]